MKVSRVIINGVLLAAGSSASQERHGDCSSAPLTIETKTGTVTGFINDTAPHVRQWLGIPYAEPPIDNRRFLPPKPKQHFGHLDTTAYQPSCMQLLSNSSTVYTEVIPEFLINGGDSEDCLYVNIYAPLCPVSEALPVFIYIPGGGFSSGGADSLYKIPDKWIERSQTHVVVIMNYRVNIFGFPNAEAQPLNAGLLDQRLVVEYVRDNIAAFGGDPDKMVLWGQSAGGSSAATYVYAYPEDPIVTGIIADSGSAREGEADTTSFSNFSDSFGCGGLGPEDQLTCMQSVGAEEIQQTLSFGPTEISFSPGLDNVTVFANYTERLEKDMVADLPVITGSNANEGAGFGGFNESGMLPGQYELGLNAITCPVASEVSRRESFGLTTYRYLYSGNFSNISPLPWIGATHSAELPILFGTHYEYRGNSTDFEWEVADSMQAFWLSFANAASKDPTDGETIWPKYKSEEDTLVHFALNNVVAEFISPDVVDSECSGEESIR